MWPTKSESNKNQASTTKPEESWLNMLRLHWRKSMNMGYVSQTKNSILKLHHIVMQKESQKKIRTWTIQRRILQIIIALPAHKQRTIAVYQAVQILNEWWFQDFIGTPGLKYHQTCWVSASPGVAKTCAKPNEPPVTESRTSSVLGSLALRRPQPHL